MTPLDTEGYGGSERRAEARVTRPFKLVRYFSITSAVAFLAVVILLAAIHNWASRKDLVRLAEIETVELGQTVSNSAWAQISKLMEKTATLDADALRSRPETTQIHDILEKATMGLPILKAKIYDLGGRTIYSTEAKEIGEDRSGNAGFISAARQHKPASKLSHKGSLAAFSGVVVDREVVETYVPVYGPNGAVAAVFELYNDVSRTVGGVNRTLRRLVISLAAAFIFLYGALYLIIRRGDRILQLQGLDIRFKSEALIAKNADLEREINERKQIEGRLQGAIRSLQEAFAFFGADDRLVFCNEQYRRLHPLGYALIKPGVRFEDIIRVNVEKGNVADAVGREEEHIRERLELHRNPKGPILRRMTSGSAYIINENRTPDGGTCLTMVDVSEVKRAEQLAKLSEDRLRGAVAAIQEGFAYYDADDRLVTFNDEYRRLHADLADILEPGMVFEDMIRAAVKRKEISDADGREEEFVQERLNRHREPKGPILRTLANGTKYLINESRTHDGGVVVTEVDVTERLRAEDALKLSEGRLRGAIESMQEGFALYDRDDRLVAINEVFKTWNPDAEKILKQGGTFEDLIRMNVERGALVEAIGREEEFLKQRLERRRKPGKPILRRFSDGRLCIVRETRTLEGGVAVTLSDVTELIRVEEALKESQQALQAVINAVPAMVSVKDSQSRYVFMNPYQAKLYGTTSEEAVGKTAAELLDATYGAKTAVIDTEVLATNRTKSNYEEDWVDKSGNGHVMLTTKAPLVDDSGIPDRVLTVSLDITDRKRAEDAQRASDERLRGAINSLQEGFLLLDAADHVVAVNELYLSFNPHAREVMERGGTFEDLLRANVYRGAIAEAIGREEEHIQKRLEQHRNHVSPFVRQFSDGRWFIVTETETPEGGTALTFSDVTELKRAEQALREGEQRLMTIIDSVPAIINVKDTQSRYLFSNRYHREILGLEEDELLGKEGGYFDPVHAKRLKDMEREVIETGKVLPLYDETHYGADGKVRHFMLTKAPLRDLSGKIVGTVTAGIDVAERKNLEEAVEAERRRLIDAIESIEGGAILYDSDDRIVLCNSTYRKHLGAIEHALVPGTLFEDVIRAVVKAGLVEDAVRDPDTYLRNRVARHRALEPSLLHMIKVDRWYFLREYRTSDGGTLIIRTDITEQKKTEEALRDSEQQMRTIMESSPIGIAVVLPAENKRLYVNPAMVHLYGAESVEQLLAIKIADSFVNQDEFRRLQADKRAEVIHEALVERKRPDGSTWWCLLSRRPIVYQGKNAVIVWNWDITDRKRAEEALRKSDERLREAVAALQEGFALFDTDDCLVLCNDEYRRLHPKVDDILKPGMRFEELVRANIAEGTNADAIGHEAEHVRERMELHRNPKGPIHRTLTDGTRFVILESRTPDGGTVVTEIDVTDRARLEEMAEAERRRLMDAIESIEGGAILYDADDRLVLCNSVYRERLKDIAHLLVPGTRFEDIVRAVAETGILAGTKENIEKHVRERIARHRALEPSLFHNLKAPRWVLLKEYRTSDGGTLIIHTDISEQKRTEEALRASEERFRDFAESASDWYWQTGPDHRCTFVSDRFFEETGYHPADIIGKTFLEFVGPDIVAEDPEMWQAREKTMKGHHPFQNFEFAHLDAEGMRQYIRVSGKPFFDADGNFAGYRGVATDITEQHDAVAALHRSEARFRDITEAASDWFWEMGPDLRYTFVSERFFEESGFKPEDVIGKTRLEFVGDRLVDKDEAAWKAHQDDLDNRRPFRNFEYCRKNRGGEIRYKRITGKPLFDNSGVFLGYRGYTTDITETRRTELELTQHNKMESLGSLAGGIAHNLNNSLQPIMILSQMTRDAFPPDSDEHQNLQLINQACTRAKELVERILAFSREKPYKLKKVDVYEIVHEELELIRSIVPTNVTIRARLSKKTGIVNVDSIQTQTVLMNIVANAIDAFEGKPGKIRISLSRARVGSSAATAVATLKKGDYAKLVVADNGPGMDEKTLGRIFDPFFTTKQPGHGTGLGLSTAIGIVYKHSGTIRAFSTPGEGATFEVFLPLAKSKES